MAILAKGNSIDQGLLLYCAKKLHEVLACVTINGLDIQVNGPIPVVEVNDAFLKAIVHLSIVPPALLKSTSRLSLLKKDDNKELDVGRSCLLF